MHIESLYNRFRESAGINTDTRTIKEQDMFVALSGENFDGNAYVRTAISKGAHHIICTDQSYNDVENVTVVSNSLETLQKLATYHRRQLKLPIVALTGSNGKTTTKELILSVLSQRYKVAGTKGNLNNHIGVPLTLLSFTDEQEIGVVEMGANHLNEIAALCAIAEPDYGLITNFGKAHLEGFGSIEGVKIGKSELYQFLKTHEGKVIVRPEDPEQMARTEGFQRRLAPVFNTTSTQPIIIEWNNHMIHSNLAGSYNVSNMELAAGVGLEFNITTEQIVKGLSTYKPENNRSQIIKRKHFTVIKDAYNANPTSMKAALLNLSQHSGNRIAILGDMFELGKYSREEHQEIVRLLEELNIDQSFIIGEIFFQTTPTKSRAFQSFENFVDAANDLKIKKDSVILIKGSRGMALERILDLI